MNEREESRNERDARKSELSLDEGGCGCEVAPSPVLGGLRKRASVCGSGWQTGIWRERKEEEEGEIGR